MKMREKLIAVANAYCEASGLSRSRVSTILFNHGRRLDKIAEGGDLQTGNYEAALQWFADEWPVAAVWPDGVERPAATKTEAAE